MTDNQDSVEMGVGKDMTVKQLLDSGAVVQPDPGSKRCVPIPTDRPLTAGDEITVRMTVVSGEETNDYRGLYYVMCRDPRDESEPPIPVLSSNILSRPAVTPPAEDDAGVGELGWLVEEYDSKRAIFKARWWSLYPDAGEDGQGWTTNSCYALRFAREADALVYINNIGWTEAKPTEHQWPDALTSTPTTAATSKGVGIGMVIAAALIAEWDDTRAAEILHAAGLTTIKDMKAAGCDDYDIDKLRAVIRNIARCAALARTTEEG